MKTAFSILTAIAANAVIATSALGASTGALPPEMKQSNVNFVSGGIGQNEAMAFQHDAKLFPLEMEFVMKDNPKDAFLADVKVTIRNRGGKTVLDTVSQGPFLLATLPSGKYRITADVDGIVKHEVVNINAHKHETAVLVWPKSPRLDSDNG